MYSLHNLPFLNSFSTELDNQFYARLAPTPLEGSHLIAFNANTAALIGLDPAAAQRPFDEQPQYQRYAAPPPEWGKHLAISCSS